MTPHKHSGTKRRPPVIDEWTSASSRTQVESWNQRSAGGLERSKKGHTTRSAFDEPTANEAPRATLDCSRGNVAFPSSFTSRHIRLRFYY